VEIDWTLRSVGANGQALSLLFGVEKRFNRRKISLRKFVGYCMTYLYRINFKRKTLELGPLCAKSLSHQQKVFMHFHFCCTLGAGWRVGRTCLYSGGLRCKHWAVCSLSWSNVASCSPTCEKAKRLLASCPSVWPHVSV
jgi:hypothetical protein